MGRSKLYDDIFIGSQEDGIVRAIQSILEGPPKTTDNLAAEIFGVKVPRNSNEGNVRRLQKIDEAEFKKIISRLNSIDLMYALGILNIKGQVITGGNPKISFALNDNGNVVIDKSEMDFVPKEIDEKEKAALIRENITTIDFDALLLCSAMKFKEALESGSIEPDCIEETQRTLTLIEEQLDNKINKKKFRYKDEEKSFSRKDLKKMMKRFIYDSNGKLQYASRDKLSDKKEALLKGRETTVNMSWEEYMLIEFLQGEEQQILKANPENYIIFLKQGKLKYSKEQMLSDIKDAGSCSSCLFELLCEKVDLTPDDICDLFDNKLITFEDLKKARRIKGVPIITDEKLLDEYNEYKRQKEDPEKSALAEKRIKRYGLAYSQTELLGKTKEELEQIGRAFIDNNERRIEEDDIIPLYEINVIPIELVIEWCGPDIVLTLLVQQKLKPTDAKYLSNGNTERDLEKLLKDIFDKHPEISYTYQLQIVAELFEGDLKAQNRLSQHYHIENGLPTKNSHYILNGDGEESKTKESVVKEEEKETRNYYRSPVAKYKFLMSADKEVWIEPDIIDGHIIIHCPNIRGGTVIVEKLYRTTKNLKTGKSETKIDNESATYIMSEEEFQELKNELIKDQKVDRRKLTMRWFHEIGYWYMHSSRWEEAIRERLDMNIQNDRMHTPEDLKRIQELMISCKTYYREGEEK